MISTFDDNNVHNVIVVQTTTCKSMFDSRGVAKGGAGEQPCTPQAWESQMGSNSRIVRAQIW